MAMGSFKLRMIKFWLRLEVWSVLAAEAMDHEKAVTDLRNCADMAAAALQAVLMFDDAQDKFDGLSITVREKICFEGFSEEVAAADALIRKFLDRSRRVEKALAEHVVEMMDPARRAQAGGAAAANSDEAARGSESP